MNKHTATPWEVDVPNSHLIAKKVNGVYQYIADCDTTMYDESRGGDDVANAAYIVKAVNAYESDQCEITTLKEALLALTEQKPLIPYEKVAEKLNRRVMLGTTQIGSLTGGGEVLQSANKNVITICHKGFYYHINLTDLVPIILDWEEKHG